MDLLFNSAEFLIFFPIVVLFYFVIPAKCKTMWLLLASYFFYMSWNPQYGLLIFFCTLITYLCSILLERIKQSDFEDTRKRRLKKACLAGSLIINLLVLVIFKYTNFILDFLRVLFGALGMEVHVPAVDIVLPVGISFFTFQALSYTIDVYRDEIYAEKNFFRYALFVSFFPQLVAGPIERSKNLLRQLGKHSKFSFDNLRKGLLLMLWGFFLKLIIADRAAIFVDTVYNNFTQYRGWYFVVATLLFAVQIYCDFYGYSTIAIGAAKVLGINLMENFNAPYFSGSVSTFWRNWHISLTSWFKDYLYIPLGGNRKGAFRKHLNKIIVFAVSGLWHGAEWSFVVWGALNGLYQVVGDLLKPLRSKAVQLLHLNRESKGHKILCILTTNFLVCFTWIFFRAETIDQTSRILRRMVSSNNFWILFDGSLYSCGLDQPNFSLLLISIVILLFADVCKQMRIKLSDEILKQDFWVRWLVFSLSVCAILLFGIWGSAYNATSFIYFQF